MGRRKLLISLLLFMLILLSGCRFVRIREEERQPLEYEIVSQDQIPQELAAIIRERKSGKMQIYAMQMRRKPWNLFQNQAAGT